ncbi:MAG: helix-turn-helix domain-containing protein [Acidimicrobiales bacterium]|nr:helix-turn-helix domain-containing protein [Acidimicrobiales bacterium]MCB1015788.1 helix-turn-helix domain-containing protein [Acidimicrobiales bacterium]
MMHRSDRDAPVWLGTTDAARELGITPRTLYRLIDRGDVPAYALGRVYRLRRSDLDTYLESVRVVPGSLGHLHGGGSPTVTPPT